MASDANDRPPNAAPVRPSVGRVRSAGGEGQEAEDRSTNVHDGEVDPC
jgi:hypothetical protein